VRPPALLTSIAVTAVVLVAGFATPAAALPARADNRPDRTVAANTCGPSRTDVLTETPWPLRRLQPAHAWLLSRGAGVTVAVIDSGVSDQHPKLAGKLVPGKDYTTGGHDPTCDNVGHGTFVAAIIAGRDTPDATFTGVAPDATILPLRVLATENTTNPHEPAIVAQAIRDAVLARVQVINLSLVIRNPTQELADAVRLALDSKIVVVAAAGNDGGGATDGQPLYPAAYPGVIAVAATDEQDQRISTSSTGSYVGVAAPGLAIIGPAPRGGGYGVLQQGGTSFAAAYVSGVAALLKGYDKTLTPAQVADRIERTADHPAKGRDDLVGYGVVNPYRAVASVIRPLRTGVPAPSGALPAPMGATDPHARLTRVAGWLAGGGLLLAVLILIAAPLLRRGRARHWRAGRARRDDPADRPSPRAEFTPVVGRTVSITAPVNRRAAIPPGVPPPPAPGREPTGGRPRRG
jgi:type VII secretion-associated serine protease mycosin